MWKQLWFRWPSIEGDDDEEEPLCVERGPADEESNNEDNWKRRFEKTPPSLSKKNNWNSFIWDIKIRSCNPRSKQAC